jgi:hypothetical protein
MPDDTKRPLRGGGELNPALRKRTESTHDTTHHTPAPVESASVQREEGRPWPWIWLVVTIVSVIIAIYLIFF